MSPAFTTSLTLLTIMLSYAASAEPLYFKAIKGDKELMILGSIHMGNQDMYPLPEPITTFLEYSDALITEIKLTDQAPNLNIDAQSTDDVLNEEQKIQLETINQQLGFNSNAFLTHPAWQTALTLQVTQFIKMGFSQELGIDAYITEQAIRFNKKILGLETVAFQLGLFTSDPNISQQLLTDTIENWQDNVRMNECLAKNWQAGNKQQLTKLADQSTITDELGEHFIYQRNQNWAEKLDLNTFIPKGQYLVVVGALHLIGEKSLLTQLSDRGFNVTQLSKEDPIHCL